MRIAFIVGRFPVLSEQFILNQITGLIDRGHDVEVFAGHPGTPIDLHADVLEYRLIERTHYRFEDPRRKVRRLLEGAVVFATHVRANPAALLRSINVLEHGRNALSLRLLFAAAHLIERPPFDIVHCHFGSVGLLGAHLRTLGIRIPKLVTTFYGGDVSKYVRRRGPDVYWPLVRNGDLFICITEDMRNRLVAHGFPAERIVKVAVGVDLSAFRPRERCLRPGEHVRLLTVARLVEKKGLETSIRAVALLRRARPDVKYRIVGGGPLRGTLERLVAELDLAGCVELVGPRTQQEVREEFDRSHIFVLASQTAADGDEEGLPGVLKEAQAMGLPVVSTRHRGIPEGVLDGQSGFLVPERDPEAMAERLQYLVDHPERWPEMGRAGRAHVEAHADIEKLNDDLVCVYERLLAGAAAA